MSAPEQLPDLPDQADRFKKARAAQATALAEDYVELIADLIAVEGEARVTEIARRLGVSHATANKNINKIKRFGLASGEPYRGVRLTEAGAALAASSRNRHRIVVELLRAVGVSAEVAEQDAEGIEHHVSGEALRAFEEFLSHKKR